MRDVSSTIDIISKILTVGVCAFYCDMFEFMQGKRVSFRRGRRKNKFKRKRGRNRDRDRDSANRSKRRRGSHSQSTEESVGNEQDVDVVDVGVSKIRSPNYTTSSFASDHNHRRSFTPAKPPSFKITDEMIGVTVPRKARSGLQRYEYSLFSFFYFHFCFSSN